MVCGVECAHGDCGVCSFVSPSPGFCGLSSGHQAYRASACTHRGHRPPTSFLGLSSACFLGVPFCVHLCLVGHTQAHLGHTDIFLLLPVILATFLAGPVDDLWPLNLDCRKS